VLDTQVPASLPLALSSPASSLTHRHLQERWRGTLYQGV